jgi:hypothetical protein
MQSHRIIQHITQSHRIIQHIMQSQNIHLVQENLGNFYGQLIFLIIDR